MDYDAKSQEGFNDPVVRGDSCQELLLRTTIHKIGSCSKCGNRRIKNVQVLQTVEMKQCKDWGIDPGFLDLFEKIEELSPLVVNRPTPIEEVVNE